MAEYPVRIGFKIGQRVAYMYLLLEDVVYDFIYYLGFGFRREQEEPASSARRRNCLLPLFI